MARSAMGEGAARDLLPHYVFNRVKHTFSIRHDMTSPKTYHAKPVAVEPYRAPHVVRHLRGFTVLAAIHLDDKPCCQTNEIREIET